MKHIKLFEDFNLYEEKHSDNISAKKAKRKAKLVTEGKSKIEAREKAVGGRLEKLFNKLVPARGKADSVEGEMVRAMMRVLYRYHNDGDFFFRGYGKETVKPSVDYLKDSAIGKKLTSIFTAAQHNSPREDAESMYTDSDGYLKGILDAAEAVSEYVESKNGEYENNTRDSRHGGLDEGKKEKLPTPR
jgi:hypothetical protein